MTVGVELFQLCDSCAEAVETGYKRCREEVAAAARVEANVCFQKLHVFHKLVFTRRLYGIMQIEKI